MTTNDYTYEFHFLDETTVRATENGRGIGDFQLAASGLLLQTMLALSWYVENTKEHDCDERLLLLLGRHLFNFIFSDGSDQQRELAKGLRDRCWTQSNPVRISLRFEQPARQYAQLPWEFLAIPKSGLDSDDAQHIVDVNGRITLTRHTPTQDRLERKPKLKVLVATYSGANQAEITTSHLEATLEAFRSEIGEDDFDFKVLRDDEATWSGIEDELFRYRPDVFHFSGHGRRDALWLADEPQRESFDRIYSARTPLGFGALRGTYFSDFGASVEGIVRLFDRHQPRLVILDACSTEWTWLSEMLPGVAHQLVEKVPSVIAMRYPIKNGSAEKFAVALYTAILEGRPLDEAVQGARYQLMPTGRSQDPETGKTSDRKPHSHRAFGTPVLYLKNSERVCEPLIKDGGADSALQMPAPRPCPRCGRNNVWTYGSGHCNRCQIVFRCRNPECVAHKRGYNKEEIQDLAGNDCPYCNENYSDISRWSGDQQIEPTAGQSRQAAQDSFGGLHAIR